jgi:hypothetical protein
MFREIENGEEVALPFNEDPDFCQIWLHYKGKCGILEA